MHHKALSRLAVFPALGTLVPSMIRIRRPRLAFGAAEHSSQKTGRPRASLKSCRAPKLLYDIFPVPIQERFVSHPTLNRKPLQTSKNILTPMR